jgi:predicted NBD/HSP70 family sugar kinase
MYLAIDIGGTKVAIRTYAKCGDLCQEHMLRTSELHPGSVSFLESLIHYILPYVDSCEAVGIACKGLIHDGKSRYASLLGGAVVQDLEAYFRQRLGRPVLVENDLVPLGSAERVFGCCSNTESFVVVNIGTGLSFASYDRGVVRGFQSCAGQLSFHTHTLRSTGEAISVERLLSGKGLATRAAELGYPQSTAADVLAASQSSPLWCLADDFQHHLMQLLSEISYFLNPERIILTGSVGRALAPRKADLDSLYRSRTDEYSWCREIQISTLSHGNCIGMVALLNGSFGERCSHRITL